MGQTVEGKTVEEQLIDAYKAQVSTYVRLLEVKDAQVAFLKERIRELETRLNSYISDKSISSTGLTAKEREEIEKLSKEIMDEELEENEWPEEMTLEIDLDSFNSNLKDVIMNAFGLDVDSLQRQINQLSAQVSEIKNTDRSEDCSGTIKVTLGGETFAHEAVESLNKMMNTQKNTTTENNDANGPCANPYPNRQESIVERYLSFRNSFTKLKWFELERLIESKFNEKAGKLLLDDSDIDSILQQFESSKD